MVGSTAKKKIPSYAGGKGDLNCIDACERRTCRNGKPLYCAVIGGGESLGGNYWVESGAWGVIILSDVEISLSTSFSGK